VADRGPQVLLARLSRLNPTTVFLATAVLVAAALLAPAPIGPILLLVTAAAMAALLSVTWRLGTPRSRTARVVILALLVALALIRLT
jgi:energy-coupling factor transporter transmembrane protein EcfT